MTTGRIEFIAGVVEDGDGLRAAGDFVIHRDTGPCSGPFRLAGHDIRNGDRITANYEVGDYNSPTHLHLFDVIVTRGSKVVEQIPEIKFDRYDKPIIQNRRPKHPQANAGVDPLF